jgi:peroxiredoxin
VQVRAPQNPSFRLDAVAGRYVVVSFLGSGGDPIGSRILKDVQNHTNLFDSIDAMFFAVSVDPEDERSGRVTESLPGIRVFWDFDQEMCRAFGAAAINPSGEEAGRIRRFSLILDERLRVYDAIPFDDRADEHVPRILASLATLPAFAAPELVGAPAPVLVVPRLFEPSFCQALIRYYDEQGGAESGFMREVDGLTVPVHDYGHKRRRDQEIHDQSIRRQCMVRLHDRLLPEIERSFQFQATRIERYIVACYDGETSGHFRAHRDNTTKGTSHRKFAVSLNLNTGDYEGGQLSFPEFGRQRYEPPRGGAVVFSCSLLHEATPVTRGKRYAFLPFLYDEASANIREENLRFIAGSGD